MSAGLSLRKKTVLLAAGNCAFLLLIFGAFLSLQFRQDVRLALFAPVSNRAADIARQVALDLERTPVAQRDALIARYAAASQLKLYLFRNDDLVQVGGPHIQLPPKVAQIVRGAPQGPPLRLRLSVRAPLPPAPPMFVTTGGPIRDWIGIRTTITSLEDPTPRRGTLLFGFASIWDIPLLTEAWIWLGIVAGAMLLSVLLWLPLVRGVTRTITGMTQATVAIADGQFDTRVKVTRTDELGSLALSINRMAGQLESFVRGQRRFLSDVAHEVRSPLGRMQVASEILGRQATPETAPYIADLQEDVELMSSLTEELLMFAKGDLRPDAIRLAPTRVLDVVQRAVQVEADGHEIRVHVDPELTVLAHADYLMRALSNLVRNAVRYAGTAGPIEVSARASGDDVLVTVADAGPGVPEDAVERIFEPFFRLDTSRTRKTGGTGLGLAIVRTCVEACRGSIECRNRTPHGLAITLRLKRADAEATADSASAPAQPS